MDENKSEPSKAEKKAAMKAEKAAKKKAEKEAKAAEKAAKKAEKEAVKTAPAEKTLMGGKSAKKIQTQIMPEYYTRENPAPFDWPKRKPMPTHITRQRASKKFTPCPKCRKVRLAGTGAKACITTSMNQRTKKGEPGIGFRCRACQHRFVIPYA